MAFERKMKGGHIWLQYVIVIFFFFVSLVAVPIFSFYSYSSLASEESIRAGIRAVEKDAEIINNVLDDGKGRLQVVIRVTEHLIKDGASIADVDSLFREETSRFRIATESEFSGVYGYINGHYIDGGFWTPPADYKVEERPWYKSAIQARDDSAQFVAYNDIANGVHAVSISRAFDSKRSVAALNIPFKNLRKFSKLVKNQDCHWVILDVNGTVIDHHDEIEIGQNYLSDAFWGTEKESLARKVTRTRSGMVEIIHAGKESFAFVAPLQRNWLLVSIVDKATATEDLRWIMARNIMIILLLFVVMILVAIFGFFRHRKVARIMRTKKIIQRKMNHEMLASINGILGMNAVLAKSIRDASTRKFVDSVGSAVKELNSLISDARDFSDFERGNSVQESEAYDVFVLFSECYKNVLPKATMKNLQVSVECDPDLPSSLWGDLKRIRQAINNLLTDAVKRTDAGGILISVGFDSLAKSKNSSEDTVVLKISIRDTGESVSVDYDSEDRGWDGASAELCLARLLIAACGGDLVIKSRYGESTTVMITIPQVVLNVEPMGDFLTRYNESEFTESKAYDTLFAPSARILVVDDVDINLKVVCGLLKDTKIQIDTAVNATQCLELVAIRRYDLILLDYSLPVMDGIKTFERMKKIQDSPNKETPVIMGTAKTIDFSDSYLKLGLTDFISKPYQEQDLKRMLAWYLPKDLVLTRDDLLEFPQAKVKKQSTKKSTETFVDDNEELEFHSVLTPEEKLVVFENVLNVSVGLEYFSRDIRCYCEVLEEFVREDKSPAFQRAFLAKNWSDYLALIHSVSGVASAIGAENLSLRSRNIEVACKESRFDEVEGLHDSFVAAYVESIEKIRKGLSEYEH